MGTIEKVYLYKTNGSKDMQKNELSQWNKDTLEGIVLSPFARVTG